MRTPCTLPLDPPLPFNACTNKAELDVLCYSGKECKMNSVLHGQRPNCHYVDVSAQRQVAPRQQETFRANFFYMLFL